MMKVDLRVIGALCRASVLFGTALGVISATPLGAAASDTAAIASSDDPYGSVYRPAPAPMTAIVGATLLTAAGPRIDNGTVLIDRGRIIAVGRDIVVPAGAKIIDGHGKWVTPGIIDPHVHLGAQIGLGPEGNDANEITDPNTAGVWVEHSVWPQDPSFSRALASGVTTMQILPGSANLFGGRSVVIHPVPAVDVSQMKFPGAPLGLKMACGENPKRIYGARNAAPSTVMGEAEGYRKAWILAQAYDREWSAYETGRAQGAKLKPPLRDLNMDTLREVLHGRMKVNMHCYRADEMALAIKISHEFGYHIGSFHHAVEAYKIAPLLAKESICVATWSRRGGWVKFEAEDAISANAALLEKAGVCVTMHSDGATAGQHLNLEAAVGMAAGNEAGLRITDEVAVRWITLNPARLLGIDGSTGSLEKGKAADVVIWNGNPFSIYTVADKVFVDGAPVFDRISGRRPSDMELGQPVDTGAPR